MLQPTSPVILVEYSQDKKAKILTETSIYQKKNQKNDTLDNLNTIKIDFAKMYQQQCSGQIGHKKYSECECGAILTVEQEKQVRRNNQLNVQQQKMKEIVWCCRYCKKENISKEIYFLESNTKILLDKNTQRGYLPPILLFLVDISGSMGQSITMSNKEKLPVPKWGQSESSLLCASKQIIEMIQKSTFVDKQSHKVEQFRQRFGHGDQLMQVSNKDKIETINYYSKIVLFMSIVENYLKKIKTQSQYSEFRVGFVFFNESVFIMKPTKQKTIPTFVHHSNSFKKQFPFEKNSVNFNCYEDLFNAGQKMERFFGDSRLKTHDFSKLMVENIDTEGQTALGPAIALALGITSAHDIGSRIVLVSDAMPNIGILSSDTKKQNQKNYQKISKFLELHQTTVGIFNWMTQQSQSLSDKYQSDFGRFVKSNKERVVEISIDLSLRQNHVEVLHTARKSLQNLINRGSIGEVLSIKLFTSNPKVEANKQKYDDANFRFVKFLGFSKKNWIQLKLKKLDEQDFMFPIYTQVVVKYEDILKKQKYVYMSYIVQRIVNVSQSIGANVQITKATQNGQQQYKQILGYMKQGNKSHIKELMNLQKLFNFETQKIVLESVASRNFQEMSLKMGDKYDLTELQFSKNSLNSLAALNNQRNRDDSDQDEIYL